jgi:circadian clock protein KaiB
MIATKTKPRKRRPAASRAKTWHLRLYVAGPTPKALKAYSNLKAICGKHIVGRYTIEVVDLLEDPKLSRDDEIIAVPTLVRRLPRPVRKIIGDLSDTHRVLVGLNLSPRT